MRKTLKEIMTEYGVVAAVLYFTIFFLVLGASYLAIRAGWSPSSAKGQAGTWVAAYIFTKLTQPIRIGVTVVLTPIVAKIYDRISGRSGRDLPSQSPRSTE